MSGREVSSRPGRACKSCGCALDGRPRTKNVDGEYRCMTCHQRRKLVREAYERGRRLLARTGSLALVVLALGALLTGAMRSCGGASSSAEGH